MEIFDNTLMTLALGGLAVSLALFASAWLYPHLRRAWDKATALTRAAFCGACVVACLFGGAKHKTGGITYPKTDTDVAYLTDAGSYVTNDAVHVAFTRVPTVPDSAMFYLDYCALDGTNAQGVATNWVNAKTATFADLTVPFDFAFANATNYNWLAYTDWTPGPAVQTNGVWHAYWGIDKKEGRYFIPVRTCVRDGGSVIATPKSKWDAATRTPDDYVQDGLIAMWDGEWNAGRGEHDPNATVWVDLTGNGHDLTFHSIAPAFGDKYWDKATREGDARTPGWAFAPDHSQEIVFCATTIHCYARLIGDARGMYLTNEDGGTTGPIGGYNAWFGDVPRIAKGFNWDLYQRMTLSLTVNSALDLNCYRDGEQKVSHYKAIRADAQTSDLIIGGRGDNQRGIAGRIYNIRIYNRELTAAEVAHNYAVDKARFGSGNE